MGVKFLGADYMEAATATLAADSEFQSKLGSTRLGLQFQVDETPSGETITYYLKVADGSAAMKLGRLDAPDATIKSSLETACSTRGCSASGPPRCGTSRSTTERQCPPTAP